MAKHSILYNLIGYAGLIASLSQAHATQQLELNRIGNIPLGNAEIVSYENNRAYVTNASSDTVDVVDLTNPALPVLAMQIDTAAYGGGINSVAVKNGIVAAAVQANNKQDSGVVVFFEAATGNLIDTATVGALPDMVIFTPDGRYVLSANEGEPDDDYLVDPEGSVSIIDISGGIVNAPVTTVGFSEFNVGQPRNSELPGDVRIFGPGASVAEDLEPEYITISDNSAKAYVSLQENNAMAVIDIASAHVERIDALGFKNYNLPGNQIDASDKDSGINIQNWPVFGMYQPDSISSYTINGVTYIVTANEGDARDYDGFSEEDRADDLTLNPTVFPNAANLQLEENIGRLKVTTTLGNTDANPADFEEIYNYGARSFSIWNAANGQLVFDSGNEFAKVLEAQAPALFNQNGPGKFDQRSDDKGAEPEALDLAFVGGRVYAFVGLERVSGIMVYDITDPMNPEFLTYQRPETISGVTDDAPEGLEFVSQAESPNNRPLILLAHEKSNNLAIYQLDVCTVSAMTFVADTLNITGSCLQDGVDVYQDFNGQLTLIESAVIVDQQAAVKISNPIQGAKYFAALPEQTTPINEVTASPRITITRAAVPVPTMSVWGLLSMSLMLPLIAFMTKRKLKS